MNKIVNKVLTFAGFDTPEETYDDSYYMDAPETEPVYDEDSVVERMNSRRSSRVVKLHDSAAQQMKVVVIQPESFEEARDITNHLKGRKPIIVNLESVEMDVARRIVDFLSGAVYALDGDIQKVSNGIFLIVPNNVGILGEEAAVSKGGFPWSN